MTEDGELTADSIPPRLGKYRVRGVCGTWARGHLLNGYDTVLDRDILLKTLSPHNSVDPEARARFQREAKVAASLQHPRIIDITDLGESEGLLFMAFEPLLGRTLSGHLKDGRLTLKSRLAIILQVLEGLEYMHSRGFVHRDVNPRTVFVCSNGEAKLFDLWVATSRDWYKSNTVMGTLLPASPYMSPEQVKVDAVDGRSDLFSVGCMLFEMVTRCRPFDSDNLMAVFYRITHDDPQWPLFPSEPHWDRLRDVVTRALEKTVAARFPDAAGMRKELYKAIRELAEHVG